jgi:hypothetical protein
MTPNDSFFGEMVNLIGLAVNNCADTTLRPRQGVEIWLLGQDSNLEPSGYKRPKISSGLGLSLHPLQQTEGRVSGASPGPGSGYELTL